MGRVSLLHLFRISVFCDTSDVGIEKEGEEIQRVSSLQETSAVAQNILLAACAPGLRFAWMGGLLSAEDTIGKSLRAPIDIRLVMAIGLR